MWTATLATTNDSPELQTLAQVNAGLAPWYRYESGTSMAAAAVTGWLALVQEFFEQRLHRTNSPALMKALLINGARSVNNTLYDLSPQNSLDLQGWGLPQLGNSLPGSLTNLIADPNSTNVSLWFYDQSPANALATGQSQTRNLGLSGGGRRQPLRVTLVWTDPPGNPVAGIKLVNDLDLIVTNLDTGDVFWGNDIPIGGDFNEAWDTNGVAPGGFGEQRGRTYLRACSRGVAAGDQLQRDGVRAAGERQRGDGQHEQHGAGLRAGDQHRGRGHPDQRVERGRANFHREQQPGVGPDGADRRAAAVRAAGGGQRALRRHHQRVHQPVELLRVHQPDDQPERGVYNLLPTRNWACRAWAPGRRPIRATPTGWRRTWICSCPPTRP